MERRASLPSLLGEAAAPFQDYDNGKVARWQAGKLAGWQAGQAGRLGRLAGWAGWQAGKLARLQRYWGLP